MSYRGAASFMSLKYIKHTYCHMYQFHIVSRMLIVIDQTRSSMPAPNDHNPTKNIFEMKKNLQKKCLKEPWYKKYCPSKYVLSTPDHQNKASIL